MAIRHPFANPENMCGQEDYYARDRDSSIYPEGQYTNLHSFMPMTSQDSLFYDESEPSTYRQLLQDEPPPMPSWRRMLAVLTKRARRSFRRLKNAFTGR